MLASTERPADRDEHAARTQRVITDDLARLRNQGICERLSGCVLQAEVGLARAQVAIGA
jgi:hypothetical protein